MDRSHQSHDTRQTHQPHQLAVVGDAPAGARIHPATMADYEPIRDLLHDSDAWHARHSPATERPPGVPRLTKDEMADLIRNERCLLLAAEVGGTLAGFLEASLRLADEMGDFSLPWCGVNNLAVRQDQRRRGLATALMRTAERWAAVKGVTHVRLTVYEFNAGARRLYERLGYWTHARQLVKVLRDCGDALHSERLTR